MKQDDTNTTSGVSGEDSRKLDTFAISRQKADDRSELIVPVPGIVQRGGVYVICAGILLALALLYLGKVNVVVVAKGVVVPLGDVRLVQGLQGGVVTEVLAQVGERLPLGAPLVRLDVSESGINLALQKRKYDLDRDQLRTLQETERAIDRILANPRPGAASGASIASIASEAMPYVISVENAGMKLDSSQQEMETLPRKKELLLREIQLVRERIELLDKSQKSDSAFVADQEQALIPRREQIESFRRLAEQKLVSPVELSNEEERFRAAQSQVLQARQRLEQQEVEISNQRLRESELVTRIQSEETTLQASHRSAQAAYDQSLSSLRQQREVTRTRVYELESNLEASRGKIEMTESQMLLASITMPVAGTIAEMKVQSVGQLVAAGGIVATIVPEGVPLIVTADVANKDIGFVRPGIEARIKVDAYPFEQFGTVPGRVSAVLPALGGSSFPVRLELLKDTLTVGGNSISLFPSLTVEVELITAKQRLIDLLLSSPGEGQPDENAGKAGQ